LPFADKEHPEVQLTLFLRDTLRAAYALGDRTKEQKTFFRGLLTTKGM